MPGTTVLLVEDESDALYATQRALESRGHKVYIALSGEIGFRFVRSVRPKVLVVDYGLPGMTGAKFIREALKVDPQIVAVVVTGQAHQFQAVEQECKALGVRSILRKPVTIEILGRAVDEASVTHA